MTDSIKIHSFYELEGNYADRYQWTVIFNIDKGLVTSGYWIIPELPVCYTNMNSDSVGFIQNNFSLELNGIEIDTINIAINVVVGAEGSMSTTIPLRSR